MTAIPVPVHFDGHNINIITEDSPLTCKVKSKLNSEESSANENNQNENNDDINNNNNNNNNHNNNDDDIKNNENNNIKLNKNNNNNNNNINNDGTNDELPPPPLNSLINTPKINIQPQINKQHINEQPIQQQQQLSHHPQQQQQQQQQQQPYLEDSDEELDEDGKPQDRQNLYKTELCREWSTSGWCYYNKRCSFAHGLQELRPVFRSKKWRTKRCRNWHTTGYCPYEHRCQFLHDQSPPRRIQDYATANARALVAAQQRMQPLYFHYKVEDPNRDDNSDDDNNNNNTDESGELKDNDIDNINDNSDDDDNDINNNKKHNKKNNNIINNNNINKHPIIYDNYKDDNIPAISPKTKQIHSNEEDHDNKKDRHKIMLQIKKMSKSETIVVEKKEKENNNNKKPKARLNKGKLAEEYFIKEKLGKGNFAVVRRVIKKSDGKEYAAKIISKKHLSEAEKEELDNECNILKKLNHPNIVGFSSIIKTPRHLYIVLELLTGGELFDRIIQKGKFTEGEAANISKQIASALAYLHKNNVVHRDLKPENIIYESKKDDAKIKITDFGLGRDVSNSKNGSMKTACGTPGYVAPEILKGNEYNAYVDLWSTGVIIYILLCGYPPFQGATGTNQMYKKIKRGLYSFPSPAWDNVSLIARDCIRGLLTVDPTKRMSAKELLEHPWILQSNKLKVNKKNEKNLINKEYSSFLSNYVHKKKFRRGVSLVITLNRMIRAAGLEKIAKEQRNHFRKRLKAYKKKLKDQQKRIYDKQQQQKKNGMNPKDFYYEEIIDPNITPQIDYRIFN